MKAKAKTFKGIDYVQLSELPLEQRQILSNTINRKIIIKILVSGKILNDCIQFKDYISWYENIYKLQKIDSVYQTVAIGSMAEAIEEKQ